MDATSIVMNTEASSLMLVDEATGRLNISIPTGPIQDQIIGFSIPKDKGIGGWVIKNNNPYVSNNIDESDLFWKDLSSDFTTRNIICVPLKNQEDKVFGVLQAVNRKNDVPFDDRDVFVFETLAEHVALAIHRSQSYEKLLNKLDEKTTQLAEVHHRLRNNLATISALIELELDGIEDVNSLGVLKATNSRIRSVADVHSMLYDSKETGVVELNKYLVNIVQNVARIYDDSNKEIRISYSIAEYSLDVNRAVLCGLILNELAVNSFKHAFQDRKAGKINISVRNIANEKLIIEISDNGVGMNFDEKGPKSLFIIKALSRKLNASVELSDKFVDGSKISVEFTL
tara:strand:- start:165 stop:1193 length:1029 start_codon:yes stop_codon:yes gene_type:complete